MKSIQVRDKEFSISITAEEIDKAVSSIAERLNKDLKSENPLFLGILNGAFIFASDIFKKITIDCEISFVKFSSYGGLTSTKNVTELIGLNEDIKGRTIVILEDIIDSGITMDHLLTKIWQYKPKAVKVASLLVKPKAMIKDLIIDYVGIEIPNDFIVGYGLDYNGHARNFPDIYKIVN